MSKFKVGDRVRLTKDNDGFGVAGDTGSVVVENGGADDCRVKFDRIIQGLYEWWVPWNSMEHIFTSCAAAEVDNLADEYGAPMARFKKGDKIRVIKLGAGGSCHSAKIGDEFIVTEIEDCFGETEVHTNGDWYFYPNEIEHIAAPATLRIEAGKFYKTRDGRKVGPMVAAHRGFDERYPFTVDHRFDSRHGKAWRADGSFHPEIGKKDDADLIAEWTDEPVADRVPGYRFTKSNPPKAGDRVALRDQGTFTVEKVVGDRVQFTDRLPTWMLWDDKNSSGCTLVLPASKPTTIADIVARHSQTGTAIVAVLENGQPRPATRPYVHTTASAAEAEANRLASVNPGKEFGVYTLGAVAKVERVYEHEWQRLAANGKFGAAAVELQSMTGMRHTDALVAAHGFAKAA